jgi:hypothetical protein
VLRRYTAERSRLEVDVFIDLARRTSTQSLTLPGAFKSMSKEWDRDEVVIHTSRMRRPPAH